MLANRFQVIRPLGTSLTLVQDRDGTPRVLKRLPEGLAGDPLARHRFRLEAWRVAQLEGPGLVGADPGFQMPGDGLGYVMHYAEGPPATLVPPADLPAIVRQIAAALAAIHRRGWVHAGLEPAAIRRGDGGAVVVGYGHLTPIGQRALRKANPDFQSPEQAEGRPLDARSDLYALGALVHYWLTGTYPAEGLALAGDDPVAAIALRMLSPDPAGRPASAEAVLVALGEPAQPPTPRLVPPPVPRTRPLRPFEEALAGLEAGEGQLHRLEGPPGLGKSSLLDQMAAIASRDLPVLRASGLGPASAPLAPWRSLLPALEALAAERAPQALERFRGRLAAPGAPAYPGADPAPGLLAHRLAWADFLRAIAEPGLVILLDDWEWADEASQALAAFLAARVPAMPVLMVVAGATVALEPAPAWSLPPFAREESFALITGMLDGPVSKSDMEAIHAVATGQPGFVRDLTARLLSTGALRREGDTWVIDSLEDWPTTEGALSWQRAADLPEAAWHVGQAAAMLAPLVGPAGLERLVDAELEAGLDALLQAGVLEQVPAGYRFTQPAFAAIFLDHVAPDARMGMHARLAKGEPTPEELVAIAAHAAGAGRPDLLTARALEAARRLLAHGAASTARTLLEEGLAALEAEHGARSAYMAALGDASRQSGALEAAAALYEEALAQAAAWAEKLPIAMALAETLMRLGRHEAARDRYREALVLAQTAEETDMLVWALAGLTEAQAALGDRESALVSGEAAVGAAADAAPLAKATAMAGLGGLLAAGARERQAEGRALLQQACGLFEGEADPARLLAALLRLAGAELSAGEPRLALATAGRAEAIAAGLAQADAAAEAGLVRAAAARALGDPALALEAASAARMQAESAMAPLRAAEALALEGLARLDAGAVEQAVAATGAAAGRLPKGAPPALVARLKLAHAEALLAASQLPEAVDVLLSARVPVEAAQRADLAGQRALLLGQWAMRTGDRDRARQELKAALASPNQHLAARAALELGRLALKAAAPTEAAGWLEQARRAASVIGARPLLAEVEAAEAALSDREGLAPGSPAAAAARIEALFQEAAGLLPRALAGAREAEALGAKVRALEAMHALWKRLVTVESAPEAAAALALAVIEGTAARHAVVLGRQMAPLAVRGREGELPYAPALIDDALAREALARKAAAVREDWVAAPILAGDRAIGVVVAAGTADAEAIARMAEAGATALARL